jgi:hypothetical protein
MKIKTNIRLILFISTLMIISLACATLTGNPGIEYYDGDVPPPPPPPEDYFEHESQLPSGGQSLFQPVMEDVLLEMAHALGYPTPYQDPYGIVSAGTELQGCMNDEGCLTARGGEMLFEDGTVGPAYYRYEYSLPLSEIEVACEQELIIQVNHLSDTYLGTLAYQNFWDEHPAYTLDTNSTPFQVHQLFYEVDWQIGLGYAWVYEDIMVEFWITGTKMTENCWGPGLEPSPELLPLFYEIMRNKGLVN